jgi:hypothetical protein
MSYPWIPTVSNIRYYSDAEIEPETSDSNDDDDESIIESSSSTSSIDEFSEYLIDSDNDNEIIDQIYYDDTETVEAIKTNGSYYLGCVCNCLLFEMAVSPRIFYKYTYRQIREYMHQYSVLSCCLSRRKPILHIIRVDIQNNILYNAVLKTIWLRLVQRHWKKICKQRQEILHLRKSWKNQRYFELHGKYIAGSNYVPSLRGMMSQYLSPIQ